jgi:hypothetical protein
LRWRKRPGPSDICGEFGDVWIWIIWGYGLPPGLIRAGNIGTEVRTPVENRSGPGSAWPWTGHGPCEVSLKSWKPTCYSGGEVLQRLPSIARGGPLLFYHRVPWMLESIE